MNHSVSTAFEHPIPVDMYDHPLNELSINPSLASPEFLSERPLLIHEIVEKPFEIPDERDIYSPNNKATPIEVEFNGPAIEAPVTTRTNPELAALVAKVNEEDRIEALKIEKVVIPAPTAQKIGEKSLLLAAASSL